MNEQPTGQKWNWSGKDWLLLAVNAILFAIFYFLYNSRLPDNVSSHINMNGVIDRTMGKWAFWTLYACIAVVLPSFASVLRNIDPRKGNYARFSDYFYLVRWALSLFLHATFLIMILTNLDEKLPVQNLTVGGLGILFVVIGNRMGQLRSNFFIGIRTPWTLMDENNWRLTHRLGARLWFATGLLMFACAWILQGSALPYVLIGLIIVTALIPAIYSYMLFNNRKSKT